MTNITILCNTYGISIISIFNSRNNSYSYTLVKSDIFTGKTLSF